MTVHTLKPRLSPDEDYVGQDMTVLFVHARVPSAPVCLFMISLWTHRATVSDPTLIGKSSQETFRKEND